MAKPALKNIHLEVSPTETSFQSYFQENVLKDVGEVATVAKGRFSQHTLISFQGIYANMRMVHILTSVVCDLVLDAAHRKTAESSLGPKREDIIESILFKSSDFVMVHFKDTDTSYARRVPSETDAFTDSSISAKVNGEHKEKDLEPWDGGEGMIADELEALETDVSNGWDPNDMFRYNEENYGVVSTYDSSLSSYTVPLERDNSEEFLKREARATQLAEEIESSAQYKARAALENDDRSEEEKYTAVQRHVNERVPWPSPCPSPSSRPPSRYQSGPNTLPPRAATPTRPPSRPPSRPSRPPSHPSAHGSPAPVSTMPKRMSSEGPPRMSPKAQRHPRGHRVSAGRGMISSGLEFVSHNVPGEAATPSSARGSPSSGTWSSVVMGVTRSSPKAHRPRSPKQSSVGGVPSGPTLSSPQAGSTLAESVAVPVPAASPSPASPASNRAGTPSAEGVSPAVLEHRKQIDDLKKFKNDFRLQPSSTPETVEQLLSKNRDGDKSREVPKEKTDSSCKDSVVETGSNATSTSAGSSKPNSPSISPTSGNAEQKQGPEVTSQGVQTSSPAGKQEKEEKDEKKDTTEQVRKSTLNPNAKEFNPRSFAQPKPSTTPTSPRPQAQPSPSMVGHQQPTPVYTQPVCFAPNMMYPVPVSPGVQPLYPIPMTPMPVNQAKTYRAVSNMPQQRQDQHHQNTMMHPASAAGAPIVATPPAYSAQYVAYSPQQFPNQPLVQHVPHYQSQHVPKYPTARRQALLSTLPFPLVLLLSNMPTRVPPCIRTHRTRSLLPLPQASSRVSMEEATQPPVQSRRWSAVAGSPLARRGSLLVTLLLKSSLFQAHVQSGMAPSHPTAQAPMMLMTTQPPPGGAQAAIAQSALQHIPVSTATHFPYMTHPSGKSTYLPLLLPTLEAQKQNKTKT
ncbi:hypothetical protein JD844_015219 [Phrynosoma platyrhinos]|uniref:LsmAD domain-containing protein n=1 Tax=Phrynosoma platyrhinos TaxID=52577 RepID=A0ABQ7T7K1_PHRPL|nr:hypothetical protein JD844_015219 [Phrynosoma platyrhinos]